MHTQIINLWSTTFWLVLAKLFIILRVYYSNAMRINPYQMIKHLNKYLSVRMRQIKDDYKGGTSSISSNSRTCWISLWALKIQHAHLSEVWRDWIDGYKILTVILIMLVNTKTPDIQNNCCLVACIWFIWNIDVQINIAFCTCILYIYRNGSTINNMMFF